MKSRLGGAIVKIGLLTGSFLLPVTATAAPYIFKDIANSNTIITDGRAQYHLGSFMTTFPGAGPSLNDGGTVAFRADLRNTATGAKLAEGIFTSRPGLEQPTVIADSQGIFDSFPTRAVINNSGTVAFGADVDGILGTGIFVGSGRGSTIITRPGRSTALFPSINNDGLVVFRSSDSENISTGKSGEAIKVLYSRSGEPFSSFGSRPVINDQGTVAFSATLDNGGRGVFAGNGGPATTLAGESSFDPAINNSGSVVFTSRGADFGDQRVSLSFGGEVTTVADTGGPFNSFIGGGPDINDKDMAVFYASLDGGERGIFTGGDPNQDTVISTGDPLFGSTVRNLYFYQGLNEEGQIAFSYRLENGIEGIALAQVIPEPQVYAMLLAGLALVGAMAKRRIS